MSTRKILFPTDFSHHEKAALEMATSLARDRGAKLLIVHVEEPPLAYEGDFYYGLEEPSRVELKEMLVQVVPTDPAVGYEHKLMIGSPGKMIAELVEQDPDVEMVVMATHGRTGLSRLIMGSVAEKVVREAKCPVLTVKTPQPVSAKAAD